MEGRRGGEAFLADFDLFGPKDELVLLTLQATPDDPQIVELWWRDSLFPDLVGR